MDALTGTAVGWPRSATFRTVDMVGLDVLGHVVRNLTGQGCDAARRARDLALPGFFHQMLERKWLGDKTGGGFYKKTSGPEGEERLALDWKTLEYRPAPEAQVSRRSRWRRSVETLRRAAAHCCSAMAAESRTRPGTSSGGAERAVELRGQSHSEIADTIVEIDRAMRLGFNWEMGPFELWDAAGVEATVDAHEAAKAAGRAQRRDSCWPPAASPGIATRRARASGRALLRPGDGERDTRT